LCISYTDDSLSNDDYSDLETPVSTRNYFRSIKNLSEIQNTLGSDSGLSLRFAEHIALKFLQQLLN